MKIDTHHTLHRDVTPSRARPRTEASAGPVGAGVEIALSPQARALLATRPESIDAARAIMQGHNLRHIRYTELVEVANQLKQAGSLKAEDYLDFIGPSPEHAQLDGSTTPGWNDAKDHVAMREQQVAFLKTTHAEQRFIDFAEYHLGLYRGFQALREGER